MDFDILYVTFCRKIFQHFYSICDLIDLYIESIRWRFRMKKISSVLVVVMIFTMLFSQFPVKQVQGATGNVPENEVTLTSSTPFEGNFNDSEQVHWYIVHPSESDIIDYTHFRMKLKSEQELNVTVYSSLENAVDNRAFDRYMGYSFENEPVMIDFPLAWIGPYYIKVEHYGGEEFEEIESAISGAYTLSYDGVTLAPSDYIMTEECPAELSTNERENGEVILKDLRTIRETVLAQTDKGKNLSDLYYKSAPFISAKMVFSKSMRENVYQDLVQLKDLFRDVAEHGSASTYKVTQQDQNAINRLYETAHDSVPAFLQKQIQTTAKSVGISNLTQSTISSILTKTGFATPKAGNRVIVKLKDDQKVSSITSKAQSYGVQAIDPLKANGAGFANMYVMEVDQASANTLKSTSNKIAKLPQVDFVEPVQQYSVFTEDSHYSYQWSLHNRGSDGGTSGVDVQFEELQKWMIGKKLKNTVIAVVDTGVDNTLADLSSSVDTSSAYNYIDRSTNAMDDNGHGTHVSGIIAAEANNHFSMGGLNSHATIMPVKVLDASGSGDTEQIAYGIKYAVDQGAQVINLSLGGSYSRVIEYALKYANDHGVTVIAASGNDGFEELSYPASSKYTISVGATNRLDIVSDYSNYGSGLDLVAPGTDIPSIMPDGHVSYMTGTSMATPHVSAVAGLLLSQNPELSPVEIQKILTETAIDVVFDEQDNPYSNYEEYYYEEEPYPFEEPVPGYDLVSGWGRLDAFGAVRAIDGTKAGMERISGANRYETAVNVSKKGWKKSDVAVIATGRNYPDALSATPLAHRNKAPLLLTDTNALPESVMKELDRLDVKQVVLVGGKSAITTNVEKQLKSLSITFKRISGSDRYETSVNVAKQLGKPEKAVVTTGAGFADALSIAPIAASLNMPILLTNKTSLPDSVENYVKTSSMNEFFVIGGTTAIPNSVAKSLGKYVRISGNDRYETNSNVIHYFADKLNMATPLIATGSNYPDALSGSALAASKGTPVFLTHATQAQTTTKKTISKYGAFADKYYIVGGKSALSDELVQSLVE